MFLWQQGGQNIVFMVAGRSDHVFMAAGRSEHCFYGSKEVITFLW